MKKLITIEGEIDDKETTAYKLSVMAAKAGYRGLTAYIYDLFNKHVKDNYKA